MNKLKKLLGITILGLSLMFGGTAWAQPSDVATITITVLEEIHVDILESSFAVEHSPGQTDQKFIGIMSISLQDTGSRGIGNSVLNATAYGPNNSAAWNYMITNTSTGVQLTEVVPEADWKDTIYLVHTAEASATKGVNLLESTFVTPFTGIKEYSLSYNQNRLDEAMMATGGITAGNIEGGVMLFYSYSL